MRISGKLAALVPLLLAAGVLPALAAPAAQAASTLYVDQSSYTCSNSGPGSQAIPFCTIQAAANVVTAGQTVLIDGGPNGGTAEYREAVTIRHSGTPSAPITFTGLQDAPLPPAVLFPSSGVPFTLDHVHDVTISHLTVQHPGTTDGVDVIGSQEVTLDSLTVNHDGTATDSSDGVSIDGASSGITVSRSYIANGEGYGVQVAPGAQHVTVTTNRVLAASLALAGISVSGTSGADVTSNTVLAYCGPDISISGGSSAVVENNFIGETPAWSACTSPGAALSVSAGSAASVHSDYNALIVGSGHSEYSWGGTLYPTAAAFAAGTGQGAHDFDATVWPTGATPPEHAQVIDSANCSAPGELATDMYGNPHVDDPLVANTGNGTCHADRGAIEREDSLPLGFSASPSAAQGAVPFHLAVTITSGAASGWNEPVSYTVDFGDGSAPVSAPAGGTVSHTYTTPGRYTLTVTAADTGGTTQTLTRPVVAGTAAPPRASLTAGPYALTTPQTGKSVGPDMADFTVGTSPDEWEVASRVLAFGDGFSESLGTGNPGVYGYPGPGTYTATLTVTDLLGRTTASKATVTVGDEFGPLGPVADFSGKVGAHKTVKLSLAALHAAYSGSDLAELRVMVASPGASGYLTVYPDGKARPAAHSLVFTRGQQVSNLVRAKPGAGQLVDFYNGSGKPLRLVVDTEGKEGGVGWGDTYAPAGPVRVLDTRSGLGTAKKPVPAHGSRTLTLAGRHGVPAAAAAVLLEVTASGGAKAGYLTVYGHGAGDPGTPDVAWAAGKASTGLVVVPLTDGKAVVRNVSGGAVSVAADVVGYYHAGGTGGVFIPVSHTSPGMVIAGRHTVRVHVSGLAGIPASGVAAVAADLTASGANASGTITGYPDGTANPRTSALNFTAHQTGLAQAVIPVGGDGAIDLYNGSSRPVTIQLDLTGCWYRYPVIP